MELWVWLALGSAVVFGLKDILAKKYFKKSDVSPKQIMFEEYFIGIFLILLFFFPLVDFSSFYNYYWLFILKAGVIGTSTLLYFELLKKYDISLVSPLLNLSPVFLLLFSFLLLGEMITFVQFLGIILIIIATYFVEVHHHNFFNRHRKNPHIHHFKMLSIKPSKFFVLAFIMLFTISFAAIFDKMILSSQINVYTNLYFTSLLIFLVLFIYFVKKKILFSSFKKVISEPQTLLVAFLSFSSIFIVLFAIAIPTALVSLIIPLRRTSTLFSALVGGILFHEKNLIQKLIATVVMLFGVLLIVL